jgi:hypothetical protein
MAQKTQTGKAQTAKIKISYEEMAVKCKGQGLEKIIKAAERDFLTPDQKYEIDHKIELLNAQLLNRTGKDIDPKTERSMRLVNLIQHGAKIDLKSLER